MISALSGLSGLGAIVGAGGGGGGGSFNPFDYNPDMFIEADDAKANTAVNLDDAVASYYTAATTPTCATVYSASIWMKVDNNDDTSIFTVGDSGNLSSTKFRIFRETSGTLKAQTRDDGGNKIGATVLSVGVWYHVLYVRNGDVQQLYLNGSLNASATGSIGSGSTFTPNSCTIGYCASVPQGFDGQLQHAAIWDGVALTADDAAAIYASGNGLALADYSSTLSAAPTYSWALDGGTAAYHGTNALTATGTPGTTIGKVEADPANNDPAQIIYDQSGNGVNPYHINVANRPIYKTSQFGSLAGLAFDEIDDNLIIPSLLQALPCYVYAVVDTTLLSSSYRILLERADVSNNPACYLGDLGTNYAPMVWWGAAYAIGSASRAKQIIRWTITATGAAVRQNGGSEVTTSYATKSLTPGNTWTTIGSSSGQQPKITLGHLSIFQGTTLDSTFDDNMFSYLNDKYGVY